MNKRLINAFLVALLIAGGCTFLLSRKISHAAPKPPPSRKYVAASQPIRAGEALTTANLELIDWPNSVPVQGAFTKIADATGKSAAFPLGKDQLVLSSFVAAEGSGIGLTSEIPAGMRAIALRSDEVVGVAGFVFPGSHVDVLVTYRDPSSPNMRTATVLQDVQVLAIGNQVQADPSGKPKAVNVVTLLLTPEAAEKAVLASAQGTIHFILRNGADSAAVAAPPVTLSQLSMNEPPAETHHAVHVSRVRDKVYAVQTVDGDKQTTASFRETE